jgi:hypothetical protein
MRPHYFKRCRSQATVTTEADPIMVNAHPAAPDARALTAASPTLRSKVPRYTRRCSPALECRDYHWICVPTPKSWDCTVLLSTPALPV